jgi:hypothetical protein
VSAWQVSNTYNELILFLTPSISSMPINNSKDTIKFLKSPGFSKGNLADI